MNSNMRLFLELGVKGSEQFTGAIKRMSNVTGQETRKMATSWQMVNHRLSSVHSSLLKVGALLGGGALFRQAVLDVTEFERGLTEMRLTAGLTAKETEKIRAEIITLSDQTLQLPEDQLDTFRKMVAAGIDPRQIIAGLKAIDKAATASFADVRDMGGAEVELFQKMEIRPEKLQRALNIMHAAGKEGKFELKSMAQYFPEVTSDAQRFGIVAEKGLAQVSAMLQIAMKGTALPSEAANNMRNFFAQITQYREAFGKIGVNIWDFIDPKSGKFRAGKDVDEFFKEIIKKSKGSAAMLEIAGIRDRQAKDFIIQMMVNWKEYERIRDKALGSADKNAIDSDFDTVSKTSYAKLKRLEIARSKAMKSAGSSDVAEKTFSLGNWAIENPVKTGAIAVGAYTGYKLLRRFLSSKLPGGMGGGDLIRGGGAGPVPVYVVNKHLSMLPGQGWGFPGGGPGGAGGPLPGGGKWMGMAGKAGMVGMAALSGYELGSWFEKNFIGGKIGEWAYDKLHPSNQVKNDIKLELNIDGGRVFTRSDNINTTISVGKQRGSLFDALMSAKSAGY